MSAGVLEEKQPLIVDIVVPWCLCCNALECVEFLLRARDLLEIDWINEKRGLLLLGYFVEFIRASCDVSLAGFIEEYLEERCETQQRVAFAETLDERCYGEVEDFLESVLEDRVVAGVEVSFEITEFLLSFCDAFHPLVELVAEWHDLSLEVD